jgi:MFS family permease
VSRSSTVYGELLGAPGAKGFIAAGFVSRLTTAMVGLGLVLAVTAGHRRYAEASAVVAVLLTANTFANPVMGKLADQRGQDKVLIPLALGFGAAMAAVIAALHWGAPVWLLFPAAAVAGLCMPVSSPMVRARWIKLYADDDRLRTAFAFEGVTTDLVYLVGPVLVTALATGATPEIGLGAVLACAVVGSLALAVQRSTQPDPVPDASGGRVSPGALRHPTLALLCLAYLGIGGVYGSVELVTVAFATAHGHRGLTGLLLAVWCAGSMASGLYYGAVKARGTLARRLAIAAVVLPAGLAPLCFTSGLALLAAFLLLAGIAMAPLIIIVMEVVQQAVPGAVMTEAISWLTSAMALGMTFGALAGGWTVDRITIDRVYLVPTAFSLLGLVALLAVARYLPSASRSRSLSSPTDTGLIVAEDREHETEHRTGV